MEARFQSLDEPMRGEKINSTTEGHSNEKLGYKQSSVK